MREMARSNPSFPTHLAVDLFTLPNSANNKSFHEEIPYAIQVFLQHCLEICGNCDERGKV
jgi:hypothetical protein